MIQFIYLIQYFIFFAKQSARKQILYFFQQVVLSLRNALVSLKRHCALIEIDYG